MKLSYCKVRMALSFKKPIVFDTDPIFLLRSVLGMSLHSMCCVSRGGTCAECEHNRQCCYAYICEGIIDKDNGTLPGRDRVSHPYVIRHALPFDWHAAGAVETFEFDMVLAGKAVEYLPYIYSALVRAGRGGLGKQRVPFIVSSMTDCDGKELICEGALLRPPMQQEWKSKDDALAHVGVASGYALAMTGGAASCNDHVNGRIIVRLDTPLRFKVLGKYVTPEILDALGFFSCIARRMHTLCALYGDGGRRKVRLPRRPDKDSVKTVALG